MFWELHSHTWYGLQNTAKGINIEISTVKTEVVAFKAKDPVAVKFVCTTRLLNKLSALNILVVVS